MEQNPDTLRRRISLYRRRLKTGVVGSLAIRYLRQIAEDDDALNALPERSRGPSWDHFEMASPA